MATRTGTCACGGIRIAAEGEPTRVAMCHCDQCQKRTGSTYSAHAYFPEDRVRVEGTTRCFAPSPDSGRAVRFRFCPGCGSTVFFRLELRPNLVGIPVGVFADPAFPPPELAVFAPRKHPWVAAPAGVPEHEGMP